MAEFISSDGTNPQKIYETITRKFTYPGGKGLKRKDDTIFFSNVYDEPTYLTFRIDFDFMCDDIGDGYNDMPHGLLNVITRDIVTGKNDNIPLPTMSVDDRKFIINDEKTNPVTSNPNNQYSAYNYLYYALGERERAKMLLQFKMGLYDLVQYCPYYITSISGLNSLMKVVTTNGIRVAKENSMLTLKCNEAIDMRITQVMNLYRKVAWDDVYQRWILPDIMRYFKMYIYITEVRVFHTSNEKSPFVSGMASMMSNTINTMMPNTQFSVPGSTVGNIMPTIGGDSFKLLNSAINSAMPTIKLECSMCEFDMSDIMEHIGSLSSARSTEQISPTIKIRVGNVKEVQSYGLNRMALSHGERGISDYIYSDNLLRKSTYITDSDNDLTEIEKKTSDPIRRLGIDINNKMEYDLFDRDATRLALAVNGIMRGLRGGDPTALLTLSGIRYMDPRSMATSYRGSGIIATLLESILDRGIYQVSRAVEYAIDRGMNFIFGFPLRNGVRVGDFVEARLTGNPIPIISAIRDYARGNATNMELKELYGKDNWEGMLKEILEDVSRSAATSGVQDRFTEMVDMILSNGPSAADVGRRIDELYDDYLKGLSSEATKDEDGGYQEPNIANTPYTSSANESGEPTDGYAPSLKGTSNEAIDDNDYNGYQHPELIRPLYTSSANSGEISEVYDPDLKGTSNEANEDNDNGYSDPYMQRTPFVSWANSGTVIDAFDPMLRGLSNEANDDMDGGYTEPLLTNPDYTSTANNNEESPELFEDKLHGTSDEANEDNDEGYTEQIVDNPPYKSTAVDRHIGTEVQKRELYSEANEDRDKGFSESSKIKTDK